jgi:hypothetical protein
MPIGFLELSLYQHGNFTVTVPFIIFIITQGSFTHWDVLRLSAMNISGFQLLGLGWVESQRSQRERGRISWCVGKRWL